MADNKKLDSIIQIDGENYEIIAKTAETAKSADYATEAGTATTAATATSATNATNATSADKVKGTLTIKTVKDGTTTTVKFDGSKDREITIESSTGGGTGGGGTADTAAKADAIQVKLDDNQTAYATITISKNDPIATEGNTGNIWFKYN